MSVKENLRRSSTERTSNIVNTEVLAEVSDQQSERVTRKPQVEVRVLYALSSDQLRETPSSICIIFQIIRKPNFKNLSSVELYFCRPCCF